MNRPPRSSPIQRERCLVIGVILAGSVGSAATLVAMGELWGATALIALFAFVVLLAAVIIGVLRVGEDKDPR